jgi:hypothetical protein
MPTYLQGLCLIGESYEWTIFAFEVNRLQRHDLIWKYLRNKYFVINPRK